MDDGVLVLSESWYPGWRARIGDRILPIHPTNVALQGVVIPAGHHTVMFEFVPRAFYAGLAISTLTLLVLLVLMKRGGRKNGTAASRGPAK